MNIRLIFVLPWLIELTLGVSLSVTSQTLGELQKQYQTAKDDTTRLKLLSDMHWVSLRSSPGDSKKYALQEIELAKKSQNPKWLAQGYNDLGICEQQSGKFIQAISMHRQALEIRKNIGDPDAMGSSLSKLGTCYSELDSLEKALEVQLMALVSFRKSANKRSIAYTLNNLAYIYQELKQFPQMKTLVEEAYSLNQELNDGYGMIGSLNYLGSLDEAGGQYDLALEKYQKALKLAKQIRSPTDEASFLNNIGTIYSRKGDVNKALFFYQSALKRIESVKDPTSNILYMANIGNIYFRKGDTKKSEEFMRSALWMSEKENLQVHKPQIYIVLGNIYSVRGNIDSASKYFDAYTEAIRVQFSDKMAKQISGLQSRYEIDIREQQKKILGQEIALKDNSLLRFRWLSIGLLTGMVLLVAIFLLFRNRQKLLQQKQLNEQRLLQQELKTRAVIETEENERTRIARELHDGIGQLLSAAKMNIASLKTRILPAQPEQLDLIENAVVLVDDAVREVRSVSHNLVANALLKNGLASAVRDFVQKLGTGGSFKTRLEIIGIQERLDPALEMMLYRVLQELVNNIIKHAGATMVSIQLIRHDDSVVLQVEDNGVGFSVGSNGNDGLGLTSIQSRVEIMHGSFFTDSRPGHGTTSIVEVPVTG